MHDLFIIVVLAVVQGIAEFLPISSSGHLVIVAALLSGGDGESLDIVDLNIVLHLGTLLSILVFYWRRIVSLIFEDRRVIPLLLVSTIPAVAIGLPLKKFGAKLLESPLLAGCLLVATGVMLLWISRKTEGDREYQRLGYFESILIGLAQALAILPGLSRSGSTISAGLWLRMKPKAAATFSFLMAIPVIAGAGLLEAIDLAGNTEPHTPLTHLAIGAGVSFVVGLASLWWVVKWLERGRLQWFAGWCIPVGLLVVVLSLIGKL